MSRPFDEARYKTLLDGLEVTEIKLSEMLIDNEDFRYDSDFFQKTYLQSYKRLKELKSDYLGNLSAEIKSFGAYSLTNQVSYLESGIPFIRCVNIKDGVIDLSNVLFISKEAHKLLWKSEVKPGMVLLTMSGSIGSCAVAMDTWEYPMNSNQDVAKISLQKGVNPYFVSAFLNTKYGQQQISRFSVGSVQQHIFLWQLEKLLIPRFSDDFQKKIEKTVKAAHAKLEASKNLYAQAEVTLLDELGLKNWSPPKESAAVKSFSESFGKSGRLDAEFYQPKYQKLISLLRKDNQRIGDVSVLAKRQFKPEIGKEFNYIEISDINNVGEIGSQSLYGEEAPSRAQWVVKSGDVISSTVRPIRRLSALVTSDQDNFVCSSGFAVLKPENIESEVLFIYLRLPIICELLDLYTSASMYPSISSSDLLDIPIPSVGQSAKKNIVGLVQKARTSNQESKRLLEVSKRAVEVAIEKGERSGMKVLEG